MKTQFDYGDQVWLLFKVGDIMAESIEELRTKLLLTNTEQKEVTVEEEWVEETKAKGENCIIGKILSNMVVNVKAMKNVFCKIWKMSKRLTINESGKKVYLFKFEKWIEKERVIY